MEVSEVPLLKSYFDDFTLLNVREIERLERREPYCRGYHRTFIVNL